jgi:hypothetical protein
MAIEAKVRMQKDNVKIIFFMVSFLWGSFGVRERTELMGNLNSAANAGLPLVALVSLLMRSSIIGGGIGYNWAFANSG